MELDLDLSELPTPALRAFDPGAPPKLRGLLAKAALPGLPPAPALLAVLAISRSSDAEAAVAKQTLDNLPAPILKGALGADLAPAVVHELVQRYLQQHDVLEKLLGMVRIAAETVEFAAQRGDERACELVAVNETRLLACPTIIEKLYLNPKTRMSTATRVLELAARNGVELHGLPAYKEAVAALQDELIVEPSDEPTPEDVAYQEAQQEAEQLETQIASIDEIVEVNEEGEEEVGKKAKALHALIKEMSISMKIRRATVGTGAERALLVKDTNKLVAAAAIKSPQTQEADVMRISANRQVHDEVLRVIANNGEWLKNGKIKFNLVANPRTPLAFAARLIPHLSEPELKALQKSRDVPAPIKTAAKQQLARKGK